MTQLIDGRYEVIKPLSSGGFGITYLAKDLRRPGQPRCVVKQLRPQREFSADEWQDARRLFDQEADTLERLGRHDQIPLLLAHLEENGNFYIIQDFIEGRTLRDELQSVKRLPESEVITLLHQGLTVLSYVHQQGVIHRDIKPENLIRRQDGVLCLIDFGIVKKFSAQQLGYMAQQPSRLVASTVGIGTPWYMPFEQERGKPRPASDIYALGIVAIEALTGCDPTDLDFDPNTMDVVWRKGGKVGDALANVLSNMVCGHYSRRYASGKEALQALEAAIDPIGPTVVVSLKAPEPKPQPVAQDDLSTEKGIDYTSLRDLLKARKWRDANEETYEVMIRAVGEKSGDWFTPNKLRNFPCTDLLTIDRLWVKYSSGKFGFSVQKKVWQECGSPDTTGKEWDNFCVRVGWKDPTASRYTSYDELKYDLNFSPLGELPRLRRAFIGVVAHKVSLFFSRAKTCKL